MAAVGLSLEARRPLNRWANEWIQPGPVASVGDANAQVRFKHSAPDLPLRYPTFAHGEESYLGSNVTDGSHRSFQAAWGPPRAIDTNWGGHRDFKVARGWRMQDLRAPDKRVEPFLGSTQNYMWQNKLATAFEARRTGSMFLPLPGGYNPAPGETPRGGLQPRVTNTVGGTLGGGDTSGAGSLTEISGRPTVIYQNSLSGNGTQFVERAKRGVPGRSSNQYN